MEPRGAFPRWLNRVWWMLFPGAAFAAFVGVLFAVALAEQRATGLGAVAGGAGVELPADIGMYLGALWLSYLLVATILVHLWFLIALSLGLWKRAQFRRWEKWKVGLTAVVLAGVWSPFVVIVAQ
ncbi:MAG TPA: hypothetical protein VLE48_03500 [Terriglobales bacterium]|nr:hypothetical protein [Terriglobales bacterium]